MELSFTVAPTQSVEPSRARARPKWSPFSASEARSVPASVQPPSDPRR